MTQLANGRTARTNTQVAGILGNVDTIIINSPTALENEEPRPDRSAQVDDINHDRDETEQVYKRSRERKCREFKDNTTKQCGRFIK